MRQTTVKALTDFFGIIHITSKDIAGAFVSSTKLPHAEISKKYHPLMTSRRILANKVHEEDVKFGVIRRDIDNEPKTHGQFEPTNEKKLYQTTDIKQAFVPIDSKKALNQKENEQPQQEEVVEDPNYQKPYRIADVEPVISLNEVLCLFREPDSTEDFNKYANVAPLKFYFKSRSHDSPTNDDFQPSSSTELNEMKLTGRKLDDVEIELNVLEALNDNDDKPILRYDPKKDTIPIQDLDPHSPEYQQQNEAIMEEFNKFDETLDEKYDETKTSKSKRALDYLKDIRAERVEPIVKDLKDRLKDNLNLYNPQSSIKLDSQGFKVYTNQVPDWSRFRHADVLRYVKQSIIYSNYDIIAVNKPYGLASHEGSKQKERFDINGLMQEIAKEMRLEKVYLAHRLDKTTTGVLLFAASQEQADRLNKLFKSDQIKKTYLCITRGVPEPKEGIIDIPIGEYQVAGKMRSCLVLEHADPKKQLARRYKEARRAISEYKVINFSKDVALVEVRPKSGVKHQIRCHLGYALGTPILGDHKYSHIGKLVPQKLPASLLKKFQLRQSKVRTLPIHLHAKSVVIPGGKANGETLFINAPLPRHFFENLKTVNLLNEDVKNLVHNK